MYSESDGWRRRLTNLGVIARHLSRNESRSVMGPFLHPTGTLPVKWLGVPDTRLVAVYFEMAGGI